MSDLELEEIDITGVDEHPPDSSVKLNGPPGTGKTTESAARVAKLVDGHGYEVSDVLWGTYRKSLATDTLDRLAGWGVFPESELSDPTEGPTRYISTLHACAYRLAGGDWDMVDGGDRRVFAEQRNLRYDKNKPWDEPPGRLLFKVFDYAANNLLDLHKPAERDKVPMLDDLRDKYPGNVATAWDEWQDYKKEHGKRDFWEQLAAPIRQGATPPHDVVVIDEYHDATPLMAKLAEQWIESAEVAIVAGDPLQVVNRYAGARPEFYNRVELPEVLLDTTHRVPEESWAVATHILSNGHTPPPVKRKKTGSFHVGDSPRFTHSSENGWSVPAPGSPRSPAHIVENHGTDTMFLTRTQKQATGVARALEEAGVLFEVQNSMDIEGWGAVEDMSERTALYNALQRLVDVSPDTGGGGYGLDAYSSDRPARTPGDVKLRSREAAALLDHTNHQYLAQSRSDTTEIANRWDQAGDAVGGGELDSYVESEFWSVYTRGRGAVRHLNGSASAGEGKAISDHDRGALKAALERNDAPVRSVDTRIYTIHASKGSEARNVVVYDGITKRIQNGMMEDEETAQNEYRTWYVALTRASANTFVLRGGFEWLLPFLPETLMDTARAANERGVNA